MESPPRRNSRPLAPADLGHVQAVDYPTYAAADAINAHGLMDLLESPANYRWRLEHPHEPSDELLLGTCLDMALTEPERFAATVLHGDRRRVKAEEGQVVLTEARWAVLQGMLAGVRQNRIALELLENRVYAQPTVYWQDAVHPVHCKARLDLVSRLGKRRVVVDIKTAREASAAAFARACANYHYDLQLMHYIEAGKVTGLWSSDVAMIIKCAKLPPYTCTVYQLGDSFFSRGTVDRDHAMQLYASCKATDEWPGPMEFQRLELPAWASPAEGAGAPEADDLVEGQPSG